MAESAAPFRKVDTQPDFPAVERDILRFWDEHRTFDKLRAKNADNPRWSFLDGPITANNPMGVHHAWGRTYKDVYNRYFAMTGRHLRYQQGFDCQGLWVEVEVEKELKADGKRLDSKRDIEKPRGGRPGLCQHRQVCAMSARPALTSLPAIQTEQQSIRLGYWMDWDRDGRRLGQKPGR